MFFQHLFPSRKPRDENSTPKGRSRELSPEQSLRDDDDGGESQTVESKHLPIALSSGGRGGGPTCLSTSWGEHGTATTTVEEISSSSSLGSTHSPLHPSASGQSLSTSPGPADKSLVHFLTVSEPPLVSSSTSSVHLAVEKPSSLCLPLSQSLHQVGTENTTNDLDRHRRRVIAQSCSRQQQHADGGLDVTDKAGRLSSRSRNAKRKIVHSRSARFEAPPPDPQLPREGDACSKSWGTLPFPSLALSPSSQLLSPSPSLSPSTSSHFSSISTPQSLAISPSPSLSPRSCSPSPSPTSSPPHSPNASPSPSPRFVRGQHRLSTNFSVRQFTPSISTPCFDNTDQPDVLAILSSTTKTASHVVPRISFKQGRRSSVVEATISGANRPVTDVRPLSSRTDRDRLQRRAVEDEAHPVVSDGTSIKPPSRRKSSLSPSSWRRRRSMEVARGLVGYQQGAPSSSSASSIPSSSSSPPPSPSLSSGAILSTASSSSSSSSSTLSSPTPEALTFNGLLMHALENPGQASSMRFLLAHSWLGITHTNLLRGLLGKSALRSHPTAAVELLTQLFSAPVVSPQATLLALKLIGKSEKIVLRTAEGHALLGLLRSLAKAQGQAPVRQGYPAPRHNLRLLSFKPKTIAREMLAVETELLTRLSFHELRLYVVGGATGAGKTTSVADIIRTTNSMMRAFTFLIVGTSDMKKRVENIEKMIEIARASLKLGNLSGVMTVVSALNFSPVSRLKPTFAAISRRHRQIFDEINEMMTARNNFSGYRAYFADNVKKSVFIPFLGVLLKDLTITDATVPNRLVEYSRDHLNVSKLEIIGHHLQVVDELIDLAKQRVIADDLKSSPGLRYLLMPVVHYSEDFLFELSYRIQPPQLALSAATLPSLSQVTIDKEAVGPRTNSSTRRRFQLSPRWRTSGDQLGSSVSGVVQEE